MEVKIVTVKKPFCPWGRDRGLVNICHRWIVFLHFCQVLTGGFFVHRHMVANLRSLRGQTIKTDCRAEDDGDCRDFHIVHV
jgi:hypothetical protein